MVGLQFLRAAILLGVVAIGAVFPAVGSLPIAITHPATSLTSRSATLNAYVMPNDWIAFATFQYGTTTGYGAESSRISVGPAAANINWNAVVLMPRTTYHFRVVAFNAYGTVVGSDATFTTPGEPPYVETRAASAITTNSATLSGYIDPSGDSALAYFDYGPTIPYSNRTPTIAFGSTAGTTTAALTALAPGTTYHYRLVAANSTGTTSGPDATFTTTAPRPELKAVGMTPQGFALILSAVGPGVFQVQASSDLLLWNPVTNFTNPPPSLTLTNAIDPGSSRCFYRAYRLQ